MVKGKTRKDSLLMLISDIGGGGTHRDFCKKIRLYWELSEEENKNEKKLFHHVASIEQALVESRYLEHQGGKGGLWKITEAGKKHLSFMGHEPSTQSGETLTIFRCENCKFFKEIGSYQKMSECHRNPPVFTSFDKTTDAFPRVSKDNFCGEYKPKETNTPTRVYILARERGVESSTIIDKCRQHNFEIKNRMSLVSPGLAGLIWEWFSKPK